MCCGHSAGHIGNGAVILALHISPPASVEQIATWDRDRTADPHLTAYPTGTTPPDDVTGKLITKPEVRLYLAYDRP